jgi:ribosome biogenesis GTPase
VTAPCPPPDAGATPHTTPTRETDDGPAELALAALGYDRHWARELAGFDGAPARVVRVDRGRVQTVSARGPGSAVPAPDAPPLVTGDWITVAPDGDDTGVVGRAERWTALVRRDPAPEPAPQTLAANMDEVWVVHAADQPLRTGWLDRALVIAWGSGAAPLAVLTKADLATDRTALADRVRSLAPDTPVAAVSVTDRDGLDALAARLHGGRTAALLGRSGAGKSSLVNALAGVDVERTAAVRALDAQGRHTTTRRALVPVAGGCVIDTPGVRALGMWEPAAGLAAAFPDIAAAAAHCRFRDCGHRGEPGCAVHAAVAAGDLPPQRLDRFATLRDEWANQPTAWY